MGHCQVLPYSKYIPLLISVDTGPLFIYVVSGGLAQQRSVFDLLCGENDKILRLGL